jgi:predicted transcriptional regulator
VKTLSEECALSSHQVMDYLEKLRVAGIVSQVQIETREDCFQPAMPVEQMTMRLFFNKIHTADFNKEDETQTQSEISKHFCNHISNIENATSEMLIKDL